MLLKRPITFIKNRSWSHFIGAIKLLTHPIFVFVSLQIVWVILIILWVTWFLNQQEGFNQLGKNLGKSADTTTSVIFLVIGCVLLGIILFGVLALFVFAQRQTSLIRQQKSFVSSVTHELRSPLASLQLSFETMQKRNLPDAVAKKLFEMVSRDVERLSRLVDRILISARLDRGLLTLDSVPERFYLADIIEVVKEEAEYLDLNLHNRIVVSGEPTLEMTSSRQAVTQILGNLVENAIKYSPLETAIEIGVSRHDEKVLITITDNGFGLAKKDLRKIFKMFHRAEVATKKAIAGTGLGLFIVKTTAKSLGGKVWVESAGLGRGSTFFVLLPALQDPFNSPQQKD